MQTILSDTVNIFFVISRYDQCTVPSFKGGQMPLTSCLIPPPTSPPLASPPPASSLPTTNGTNENCENCKKNVIKEPEPVIIVDESQQNVIDSQQKTIDSQQKAIDDLKRQIEQYKTSEKQMNRYHNNKLIFFLFSFFFFFFLGGGGLWEKWWRPQVFWIAEFFSLVESGFEQLPSSFRNGVPTYIL